MCGETPLQSLHCAPELHDEKLRSNVFISLLRCGATVKSHWIPASVYRIVIVTVTGEEKLDY